MKKQTRKLIPIWIILLVLGILFLIVSIVLHFPSWAVWLGTSLCFGTMVGWILIHCIGLLINRPKNVKKSTGNQALINRVSKEINEAISRYLHSVKRKGLLKRSALYERPWFLVCGPKKSGKTQLLAGSGLTIPLKYPDASDGVLLSETSGISWNFGNDAVWADMPGMMMGAKGTEEWRATVNAIHNVRSERAIDGVIVVVSAGKLMDADPRSIKNLAGSLRDRLDELISAWGIEFPVYCIFNRSDEIPGFKELFRDPAGKWGEQIFGASLSGEQQRGLPRQALLTEYAYLCDSLRDIRLRMLAKEKNEEKRRLICRFVIHFEGIQEKLADFVAELFRSSSYEGKPVFRGFYFTSCITHQSQDPVDMAPSFDISNTIMNHPLNPHGMKTPEETAKPAAAHKDEIQPFFTHSLFREVIPTSSPMVKKTQKTTRRELTKHLGLSSIFIVVAVLIGWYIYRCAHNAINLNDAIKTEVLQVKGNVDSHAEAYRALGKMGDMIAELKTFEEKGVPLSMGMGMYKGDKLFEELKKEYFAMVKQLIVGPSMKYLEFKIKRYADAFGELTGDEYNQLYDVLKAYLSISEAISDKPALIDTVSLKMSLFEAIKNSLLVSDNASRLSENVETVLFKNISLYLTYLKKGLFPLIQENQRLVSQARKRLQRLPNAQVLYKTILSNLSPSARQINLNEILDRNEAGGFLVSSHTVSVLYTQEGWDQSIANAIKEACKNPYKIDWVMGTTKDQLPETKLNLDKLYDTMVELYFRDVKKHWLQFIASVRIEPFGDLSRSARILLKFGSNQSELLLFFNKIAELTKIIEKSQLEDKVPNGVSSEAENVLSTAVAKKVRTITKLQLNPKSIMKRQKLMKELSNAFEPLRVFIRSEGGALRGLEGYRDKILSLSEKLTSIESIDGDNVISVFNGKESDPLYSAWKYTKNEIETMPEEFARVLKALLLTPLGYTGKAITQVLSKQLNTLWYDDVVTRFSNSFTGRYPFSRSEEEALFNDVMDFFRPKTGIFWGFYDRRLSSFLVKKKNRWYPRPIGSVNLTFAPALYETLAKADKIKGVFYQPDGTERIQTLTFAATKVSKNKAVLTIGTKEFTISPGADGDIVQFRWPNESGSNDISLKIFANNNVAKEFRYAGSWGLLRLFDSARFNIVNQSSFIAKWQVNVQNMYMIYFACRVRIAGKEHPFNERLFNEFSCPDKIITTPSS